MTCRRIAIVALVLVVASAQAVAVPMAWDGNTVLYDINFRPENFLDINSDQFRPAEEIRWYEVENGWRVAGGSLESNRSYLFTDIRLKRAITSNFSARLNWSDEEFYAPRDPERPLLELELRSTAWPVSVSLLGAPAYAKSEADLGMAVSLGLRPWNYLRLAWLRPDFYFKNKNDFDNSYYRRSPGQIMVSGAYEWGGRCKLRFVWHDNKPLEFVFDDRAAVFAYRNRNLRASFDYRLGTTRTLGIVLRGFATRQSRDEAGAPRSQDIRYRSFNAYWIQASGGRDQEWTLGVRYDEFRNRERNPADSPADFDFLFVTSQVYSVYYLPVARHQAMELGLYLGDAAKRRDYRNPSLAELRRNYFEALLRTGWNIFSSDSSTALTLAVAWNLDDLIGDSFDGGSVRFRSEL